MFHNLDILEKILGDKKYLTGDDLTIADLSFVTWISTMSIPFKVTEERFPKITAWRKRMESLPCYDINREGLAVWASRWNSVE